MMANSHETPSQTPRKCPRCERPLRASAHEGLCPACVLRSALVEDTVPNDASMHFAGYDLYEKLGEGGMGIVYKAHKSGHPEHPIAIKLIRDGELATPAMRRRFISEMNAVAELRHEHIVPILEIGEFGQEPYFTMEFMPGGNLAQNAAAYSEPRKAAALMAKVAWAVHAGHQRRILHRDIKPANVLFDEHGEPRLSDFGLAKQLDIPGVTTTGHLMGTPSYLAPERALDPGRGNTVAADIWSLGVVLYEVLAGERPFRGRSIGDVIMRVVDEEPEPLTHKRPGIDAQISHIVRTCLQKQPGKRYPSARMLAEDLDAYVLQRSG